MNSENENEEYVPQGNKWRTNHREKIQDGRGGGEGEMYESERHGNLNCYM